MTGPLRLLGIFPHPDDETLGVGTTLAKYAAEGVETYLLCATRGEGGWSGPADKDPGPQAMARIREAELDCAARALGLRDVCLLDYIDGEVDQADPRVMINRLVSYIRRVRPQVVITYAVDGVYGHPDHIAMSQFTAAALVCAADAQYRDQDDQPPHRVAKFYHMAQPHEPVQWWIDKIGPLTMQIDGVERSFQSWEPWAITTVIDGRANFDVFWAAMLCHQSQHPNFQTIFDLPRADLLEMFGMGSFIRVYSMVNGGRAVETDLFEGLR